MIDMVITAGLILAGVNVALVATILLSAGYDAGDDDLDSWED